jgi:hypothetical protein
MFRLRRQPTLKTAVLLVAVASALAAGAAAAWRSLIGANSFGPGYYALLTVLPAAAARLAIALLMALKSRDFVVVGIAWTAMNIFAGVVALVFLMVYPSPGTTIVGIGCIDSFLLLTVALLKTGDDPISIFVGQILGGLAWSLLARALAATCREMPADAPARSDFD